MPAGRGPLSAGTYTAPRDSRAFTDEYRSMAFRRLAVMFMIIVASALAAWAYNGVERAEAQAAPDIDLGVEVGPERGWDRIYIEGNRGHEVALSNYGTEAALGVTVEIRSPGFSVEPGHAPLGSVAHAPGDSTTLLWRIPNLPPNSRYHLGAQVSSQEDASRPLPFLHQMVVTVTSEPPEAVELQRNNRAEFWSLWEEYEQGLPVRPVLALRASVDNPVPSPGEQVEFTVTGSTGSRYNGADVEVRIELGEGLTYQSHAAPQGTTFNQGSGVWDLGIWNTDNASLELTLTAVVSGGAGVHEPCLTATLVSTPPERIGDDPLADNSAKICVGEPPDSVLPVLFQEGETDLVTLYDCVGVSTYPCGMDDSLKWVALGGTAAREGGFPDGIFRPEDVVVHVPDTLGLGRHVDSSDMPVWSTGFRHLIDNEVAFSREGVVVSDNLRLLDKAIWGVAPNCPPPGHPAHNACIQAREVSFTATISGPDPGTANERSVGGAHNDESVERVIYDFDPMTGVHNDSRAIGFGYTLYYEFGALGTYTLEVSVTAKHNNNTPNDDTDNVDYTTPAATYTFHVGPIAELEVRDGDGGADLAQAETRAFTIVAVNNGPDDATAVQVEVTGLSANHYEAHKATAGSFDRTTGVWTIGELKTRDFHQAASGRDGEVLTIVSKAPSDTPVTAEIENTQDYRVCINSSGNDVAAANESACTGTSGNTWHTTPYYDYKSDNNSKTITGREGTAGDRKEVEIATTTINSVVADGTTQMTELRDPDTGDLSPVQAEVTVPASTTGGTANIDITVKKITYPDNNSTAFAFEVTTAHTGTVDDPLTLQFHITTDTPREMVQVHYEGDLTPLDDCDNPAMANPDPCVAERGRVNDVVTITVLTTGASVWRVALPPPPGPEVRTRTVTRTVTETVYESEEVPAGLQATPQGETEIALEWDAMPSFKEVEVAHYRIEVFGDAEGGWSTLADELTATAYAHTGLSAGDTRLYRVFASNVNGEESGPSGVASAVTSSTVTETVTRTVTETVYESETPYARFAEEETTRTVLENSAPGSPVGAPVAVLRNSGNRVAYSLEGADAALFAIEEDTGQILVGQETALDFESERTSYTVEVVADPSSGATVRATVTINVVDAPEAAAVAIGPAGQPQVGQPLTATLTHSGGEPGNPRWQWQRSAAGGLWLNIAGATLPEYTPTEEDSGKRLRALATYTEPQGDQVGLAGAVTEALPAEEPAPQAAARFDANGDGRIDLDETLAAIAAYFREELDSDGVLEIIGAYFSR